MQKSILNLVIFIIFSCSCYSQGYLGLTYGNLTKENLKKYPSVPFSEVYEIEKNSPAFNAGIQKGDILLTINNKEIGLGKSNLSSLLMDINPYQEVKLELLRNNKKISLQAILTEWPKEKLEIAKNLQKKQKEIELEYEWLRTHNFEKDVNLYITHINKVLELNPDDYHIRKNKVLINWAAGNPYDAIKDAEILLKTYKSNLDYQTIKNLLHIKIRSIANSDGFHLNIDYSKAKKYYEEYYNMLNQEDKILKQKIYKSLNQPTTCAMCNGRGFHNQDVNCNNCYNWNYEYRTKVPCHVCKDTRKVRGKVSCGWCSSTGIENKYHKIDNIIMEEFEKNTNIHRGN